MPAPQTEEHEREYVEMMEQEQRKTLEKYAKQENGKIAVNWVELVKTRHRQGGESCSGEWDDILYYLKLKGVLKSESEMDGFFLMGCGADLSPTDSASVKYHFSREEDAESYRQAEYARAKYPVRIAR